MSHPSSPGPTKSIRKRKRKTSTSDVPTNKRTRDDCQGTPYGCRITQRGHTCKLLPQTPKQTPQDILWRRLYHYIAEASEDAERRSTRAEPNTEGGVLPHPLQVLKRRALNLLDVPFFEQIPEDRTDAAYNLPFTFNTDKCWTKLRPTHEQIDGYLSNAIEKDMGTVRSRVMYQQLALDRDSDPYSQPKPVHGFWEVERCIDLIPPKTMHINHPFTLPDWMTAGIDHYTYNVTPRHSFADLHADEGCGVLAWPLGSVKIWITFGPEKRITGNSGNRSLERDDMFFGSLLDTMMRESGIIDANSEPEQISPRWPSHLIYGDSPNAVSQFSLAGPNLPHNIYIACTEDNKGLYLPPGWKHVMYTLRGGYIGGLTFVPKPEHLLSHASGMMRALNLSTKRDHLRECRDLFLHIAKLATTAICEAENIEHPSNTLIARAERLQTEMKTAVLFYRGNQEVVRLFNSFAKRVAVWKGLDEPPLFELPTLKVEKKPQTVAQDQDPSGKSAELAQ
ncbi:hypothetical protein BDD12DRAFT_910913 [Trichophaea hybrida]|nr:hypothetical protein BDD12DRAFT_910913 [Trichophaea hybrida]